MSAVEPMSAVDAEESLQVQRLVLGELGAVLSTWRRLSSRPAQRTKLASNPLYLELEKAREHVSESSLSSSVDVLSVLGALLRVVRSDATSGALTLAALQTLSTLLSSDALLSLCSTPVLRRVAVRRIVSAVAHCRFEASDHDSDEVVLAAIVRVLALAVQSALGTALSVRDVEHCVVTCAKMSAQGRLSHLLRRHAEHALHDMLATLANRYRSRSEAASVVRETSQESAVQIKDEEEDDLEEEVVEMLPEEGLKDNDKDKEGVTPISAGSGGGTSSSPSSPVQLHRVTTASGTEKIRRVRSSISSSTSTSASPRSGATSSQPGAVEADPHEVSPEESPEELLVAVVRYLCAQLEGAEAAKRAPQQRTQTLALLHSVLEAQRRTATLRRGALLTRALCDDVALCALQILQRAVQPYLQTQNTSLAPTNPNVPPPPTPPPPPAPTLAELELLARALRVLQALWEVHGPEQRVALDLALGYVIGALGADHDGGTVVFPLVPELREVLVDALIGWSRDTALLHALVLHCDAKRRSPAWAQRLLSLLARTAEDTVSNAALALSAQDALAALLRALHSRLRHEEEKDLGEEAAHKALETLHNELAHKEALREAAKHFNDKPSRGIEYALQRRHELIPSSPPRVPPRVEGEVEVEVEEVVVARYLRYNPFLSAKAVGEYLGDKKDYSQRVLSCYVRTFDVRSLPYLHALRVYLESFRPVGEAQVIDRYIDKWCAHYLDTNTHSERAIFASHDALFTLTYSVIMLNVDLHSPVLVDRPKMTLAQYTRNVEDLNDNGKFPRPFLEALYAEVRDDEIKIHAEHALRGSLSAVTWRHLRSADLDSEVEEQGLLIPATRPQQRAADTHLFDLVHAPLHRALRAAALAPEPPQLERALALAQLSALCAAQLAHSRALDDLLTTLAQLTQLTPSGGGGSAVQSAAHWGSAERAMYAAIALFTLARKHALHVRSAWPALIACLAALCDLGLVPSSLYALDDPFALLEDERADRSAALAAAQLAAANASATSSSSWFSWLSGGSSSSSPSLTPSTSATSTSTSNTSASTSSHSAATSSSPSDAASAQSSALDSTLDPVTRRLLESARRSVKQCKLRACLSSQGSALTAEALAPLVRALVTASQERALSSSHAPSALLLLDWLAQVTLLNVERVSLLWGSVSSHLEQLCGAQPRWEVLSKAALTLCRLAHSLLAVDEVRVSALQMVLLVTRLALVPTHAAHATLRRKLGAAVRVTLVHNLSHLRGHTPWQLVSELLRWCTRSPLTARDALVVLAAIVRGGDVTSVQSLDTVHELRATAISEDNFALVLELLGALVTAHTPGPGSRELSARALAQLHQLVHAVPLFCPLQVDPALEGTALTSYWLPLLLVLSGFATQKPPVSTGSSDTAPPPTPTRTAAPALRHQALSHLQRALLAPALLLLSSDSWRTLFDRVLFPLLEELLRSPSTTPDVLEEERLRAASILCKTFLQYLSKFIASRDFAQLWLRVLHFIEAFIRAGHSELLVESVTQALKNILLVMHASGIDHGRDASTWWPQTWAAIDRFCPKLRPELASAMPLPAPAPATATPAAVTG